MKTVIDAVNEYKGIAPIPTYTEGKNQIIMAKKQFDGYLIGDLTTGEGVRDNEYWKVICTREQFNQCVDDMSSNFGPGSEIRLLKWQATHSLEFRRPIKQKYNTKSTGVEFELIEEVNVSAKDLSLGSVYEFSDDHVTWEKGELLKFEDQPDQYLSKCGSKNEWFRFIRIIPVEEVKPKYTQAIKKIRATPEMHSEVSKFGGSLMYNKTNAVIYWVSDDDDATAYAKWSDTSKSFHPFEWRNNGLKGLDLIIIEYNEYKTPESPEYTQAMCDAGELPGVGMMVVDDRNKCEYEVLLTADSNGYYVMIGCDGGYHCELLKYLKPLTPTVVLEDGKAYQFELGGVMRIGVYCSIDDDFKGYVSNRWTPDLCTNIILLTPEVKS